MTELNKTIFHALHLEAGAKMVPFAGYDMPVQYPLGVKKEHLHTRQHAGLFDVSHMGQIRISGHDVPQLLEALMPVDIIDLPINKQRYGLFTTENGAVLDDLMITHANDHYFLVVNAACKSQDIDHLQQHLSGCNIEVLTDHALLALQGPDAKRVMAELAPDSTQMTFMTAASLNIEGIECFVTRSGYTGEDGFEISVPNAQAERLAKILLAYKQVEWIGLGARDSLRLEAGLCLYGQELTLEHSPIESSLLWAISKIRRPNEARAGNYLGASTIGKHILNGVSKKRVGIRPLGKMPVREGVELFDHQQQKIGYVSSGGFGPSTNTPIAMAFVETEYATIGTQIIASVRNKHVDVEVVKLPFVQQNYYRGE